MNPIVVSMASIPRCTDDASACARNSDTAIQQCGDQCVTNTPGCTL